MENNDERPYGWGRCYLCGEDCEEDDYDDDKRRSTCKKCHARQAQSADELQAEEVFTRR
jgi:hypothetical protein